MEYLYNIGRHNNPQRHTILYKSNINSTKCYNNISNKNNTKRYIKVLLIPKTPIILTININYDIQSI